MQRRWSSLRGRPEVTAVSIADQVHAEEVLSAALTDHVGEWVAVRGSKIVAIAPTLEELTEQVEETDDSSEATTAFEVGDDADVGCFF